MNAISTITVLPENKEQQEIYVQKVKDEILSGNNDTLKVYVQMKRFEAILKDLLSDKDIKEFSIAELEKYTKDDREMHNAVLEIRSTGRYDFTKCGHNEYNDICDKIKELTERKKELENTMKAHSSEWVEPFTGEVIQPPIKSGNETIVCKLK